MTYATSSAYRSAALTLYARWCRESERDNLTYSWSHYADAIELELEHIEYRPQAGHYARLFEHISELVSEYGGPKVIEGD